MTTLLLLLSCIVSVTFGDVDIKLLKPIQAYEKKNIQFQIKGTNISKLLLKSLKDSSGEVLFENKELKQGEKYFSIDLDEHQSKPGLYKFQFQVNGDHSVTLYGKVFVAVEVIQAKVAGSKIKYGNKVEEQVFDSGLDDKFKVQLTVQEKIHAKALIPQQAVVRFRHVSTGTIVYFPLKATAEKELKVALQMSRDAKKFQYNSGKHQVAIVLADNSFESSLEWDLGTITLNLAAKPPKIPSPLYVKPLLEESDTTLKALPEITHMMRPQDSRPPAIVSLVFTALVLSPLGGFMVFLKQSKVNFARFPSGMKAIWALGFFLFFAAMLGLFVAFWIQLRMKETLGYAAIIGVPMIVLGHKTLQALATTRSTGKKTKTE